MQNFSYNENKQFILNGLHNPLDSSIANQCKRNEFREKIVFIQK